MKTISFFNVKGGVGKTTSVLNLSYFLALAKKRVLVIDIDGQANLSKRLGMDVPRDNPDNVIHAYHLLGDRKAPIQQAARPLFSNFLVIPSGPDTPKVVKEIDLAKPANLCILRDNLRRIKPGLINYCLIDCAAGEIETNKAALAASDVVIVPTKAEPNALDSVVETIDFMDEVKQPGVNPNLVLGGVLLTDYHGSPLEAAKMEMVRGHLGETCLKTVIRHTRTVPSAAELSRGFVHEYSPAGLGSADYQSLASEFLARFPDA